jgi:glycosyltransferase involved in cell wall biosynthesis
MGADTEHEMIERRRVRVRVGSNVLEALPPVSVVIPAYNAAATLPEAVDSVLAQKFRGHEIIVVDDGSPNAGRLEAALGARIEQLVYIKQRSAGAGAARNVAITHARAPLIAFLDADDTWMPDFLASQIVFLERHAYDMVYCDAMLVGMQSAYRRTFMQTAPSKGTCDVNALLDLRCNVITSGTLARKQAIVDAGMFEMERVRAHDFHLWLRMAKNGAKIGYQEKVLVRHRVTTTGISGDSVARAERERDAFERVRRTIELAPEQQRIVERRLAGLEADLAVEEGKSYLLSGDYRQASAAFCTANRHRRSLKLSLIAALARLAPQTLLRFYRAARSTEITMVPQLHKPPR